MSEMIDQEYGLELVLFYLEFYAPVETSDSECDKFEEWLAKSGFCDKLLERAREMLPERFSHFRVSISGLEERSEE